MIEATFKTGNYNNWDNLVSNILPSLNLFFRNQTLPFIDKILVSMLGENSPIEKTKVDVEQIVNSKSGLESILYKITYTISDFKSPGAPKKAIENDENAIRESIENNLVNETFRLKNLKINTMEGTLYLEFNAFIKE